VLVTSGTTGAYKSVLITPAFGETFLRHRVEVAGMNADTVLSAFDFAPWTGIGYKWAASPWMVGGTTIILQDRPLYLPLTNPKLTHSILIPAALDKILAAPEDAFARNDRILLSIGGAPPTRAQFDAARRRITTRIYSNLSATECGIFGFTPLETLDDRRRHRLVPGRTVEIVDEEDRPLAAGNTGRLRIATAGGPNSYLCLDAASQDQFRDGYFYPGDLAVRREDGRIALQGRISDVINMAGVKISPAPIEERLREAWSVSGICLLSMQDDRGEEEIHVVLESDAPIVLERLAPALNKEMHGFTRARVHVVAALPRNDMGKIMRSRVRELVMAKRSQSDAAGPAGSVKPG
jgi:acyl-coenzyme A synthetase/AMP-(fatty) acid ligase